MKKIFFLVLSFLLTGCVSITEQLVPIATLDSIAPGNALIIVERMDEDSASAHLVEVTDNGKVIGKLGVGINRHKYKPELSLHHQLIWERPEGEMELKLTPGAMVKDVPPITENIEAGKVYKYIVKFKWKPYGLALEKMANN